jgi:cytochrome c556
MMKNHLRWNMRDHLAAINESARLMSLQDFEGASRVIHDRLGSSEAMKRMCGMFGNDAYRDMGLAFHASADLLAVEIRSKEMLKIMSALSRTMERCVACHNTFRLE